MALLFFWIGFYSLLTQVLLIRELAVIFHGHEISFGVALTAWLVWGGAGSISQNNSSSPQKNLLISASLLSLAAPISDIVIRFSKLLTPSGNIPGLFVTLILPFILLALPSWLFGVGFGSGASFVRNNKTLRASHLYFFESVGALFGGLISTGIFLGDIPSFVYLSVGGIVLLFLTWFPFRSFPPLFLIIPTIIFVIGSPKIDHWSRQMQWGKQKIITQKETPYGHAALTRLGDSNILYENGTISAQFPDPEKEEGLISLPLLCHEKPDKILTVGVFSVIGLKEILKHPVQLVEIVNPDYAVLHLIKPALGVDLFEEPRVKFHTEDPRIWIRNRPNSYDVILQTLPEPENAALNRFFTEEFFQQARQALKEDGILVFFITSSPNYLPPEITYMNASIIQSLEKSFEFVEEIPGAPMIIIASRKKFSLDPGILEGRYRKRKIKTQSLVPENFPYLLHPERMNYFRIRVQEVKKLVANRDLYPISLFLKWRVWLSKFVSPVHILGLVTAMLIFFGLIAKILKFRKVWLDHPESLLLLSAGFAGMAVEVILLYLFQSVSGSLYWQMGVLIASFMAGLSFGSGIASFFSSKNNFRVLVFTTALLSALCAVLAKNIGSLFAVTSPIAVFAVLLACTGFLVGALFPLSVNPKEEKAQVFYAVDLWGAALGAFSAGTFLAPLLGYAQTLYLSSIVLGIAILIFVFLKIYSILRQKC